MRRGDLIRPGLLLLVAVAFVHAEAAPVVGAPMVLAAVAAVAERLAALRRRGRLDTVLVTTGGTLVALILLGLLLDRAGIGLHPKTWALTLGVGGALGLVLAAFRPAPPSLLPRPAALPFLRAAPWVAGCLTVVVVALSVSSDATSRDDVAPPQMSFGPLRGTAVAVVVSSGTAVGPLELRTVSANGTTLSYPLFRVPRGASVSTEVALPTTGRYVVTLNNPSQAKPLRTLVLDR